MSRTVLPGPEIFFRPVHGKSSAKSGKSPANLHIKRKTAFSRRVNKIVNKFFSMSLSVRHYSKIRKFFQNISSATFLPLLTKFGHNSAINSSGQIFFSPAPFELFGRNFGHLATLSRFSCVCGGVGCGGVAEPVLWSRDTEIIYYALDNILRRRHFFQFYTISSYSLVKKDSRRLSSEKNVSRRTKNESHDTSNTFNA